MPSSIFNAPSAAAEIVTYNHREPVLKFSARHPRYISPLDIHVQRFTPLGRLNRVPRYVRFQLRTKAATLKPTSLT